ncbi:Stealth CR1 domain-containing protein [Lutibacter holmesii]|uniref:Stealth CR1 domain-containing protein n=1 Tax=Lutibacter holmesii TaxID=1137985 RepID=A0ABW3WSP1_9FLAO
MNVDYPIDAVILWVDGNDELHKKKMLPFVSDTSKLKKKSFRERFDQVDEIQFSVNSILKFAPYIRNIFVVTDNQIPGFLKHNNTQKYNSVKIIDHKDIFIDYQEYLPTFNCLPIETMITNIPGLAENFIYFNDDFFLIKKTTPSDFFREGKVVLRGEWRNYDSNIWHKNIVYKIRELFGGNPKQLTYGFKRSQQNIARKLGVQKYYKFDHTPAPLKKSTIDAYFKENPDMKLLNAKHKFRHHTQFTLQGLGNHLEIMNNNAILKKDYQLVYFGSYGKPFLWYKFVFWCGNKQQNKLFMCLQSLNNCSPKKLKFITTWLSKQINDA